MGRGKMENAKREKNFPEFSEYRKCPTTLKTIKVQGLDNEITWCNRYFGCKERYTSACLIGRKQKIVGRGESEIQA